MLKPLLQCLLAGALLFGAERFFWASPEVTIERIEVSSSVLDELRMEAEQAGSRTPSEAELARRLDVWIDDEVLVREARRLGLDRGDPVIVTRLVQNMRFVGSTGSPGQGAAEAPSPEEADALYREALELGMDRTDLVVRRRLIQQMRFLLEAPGRAEAVDDAMLEAHLAENGARFSIPARVALVQIYLSRDRRGASLEEEARTLVARLRREAIPLEQGLAEADPFLHPARQPLQSERQLAKQFGPNFARAALAPDLPSGEWVGPVESAYGMHALWILERTEERVPALDEVRTAVEAEVRNERAVRSMAEGLRRLRSRYSVAMPEEAGAARQPREMGGRRDGDSRDGAA